MPHRIELRSHHSLAELKAAWKKCLHPVEKTHWHLLWRYAEAGEETRLPEVARECGVEESWARRLIHRYNAEGAVGVRDRRRDNGSEPLLDEKAVEALRTALQKPPGDGGLWSGPKVAQWMGRRLERTVAPQVGGLYLKKLKMSWKVPRPQHAQSASAEEKQATKKTLRGSGCAGAGASRQNGRAVGRG